LAKVAAMLKKKIFPATTLHLGFGSPLSNSEVHFMPKKLGVWIGLTATHG
jgi:hypothetical protein